jgi:hypothetical protein
LYPTGTAAPVTGDAYIAQFEPKGQDFLPIWRQYGRNIGKISLK